VSASVCSPEGWTDSALQKPLRRLDIQEVSGEATLSEAGAGGAMEGPGGAMEGAMEEAGGAMEGAGGAMEGAGGATLLIQEAGGESSPLSSSPSAKMIKIEDEIPSNTSNQ